MVGETQQLPQALQDTAGTISYSFLSSESDFSSIYYILFAIFRLDLYFTWIVSYTYEYRNKYEEIKMKNWKAVISFIIFTCFLFAHAQLPGTGLPGGATGAKPQASRLLKVSMDTEQGMTPDEKAVFITFQFNRKPSNYFHYYMNDPTRLVFDFNDTKLGDDAIVLVPEQPYLTCNVEGMKVDINRDVEGLEADIRDMVRISMSSDYKIHYSVRDERFSVILNYHWSTDPAKQQQYIIREKSKWWLWTLLGTGAVGGGVAAWWFTQEKEEEPEVPLGTPPAHPAVN